MSACNTARTSAVFCGKNVGRNEFDRSGASLCIIMPPCGSGGPNTETTSGKTASSVENVRVNWSNSDFLGSTLVGDKQESNTDLSDVCCWSAVKLRDCFFLPPGVELVARNSLLRRSVADSFSRGGLFVIPELLDCCCCIWDCCTCCCCVSELWASASVLPAPASLPELSFFQSRHLSMKSRNRQMDNWFPHFSVHFYTKEYR